MKEQATKGEVTIELTSLKIGYSGRVIHPEINASLRAGEITSLMGLNGAGKSTLLRTICGFQPPLAGEVTIMGRELREYSQSELSLRLGVVLTERVSSAGVNLYDLVSLGRHPYTGLFGKLSNEDHAIIREAIDAVGMGHKSSSYVGELSDGERQKGMIAKSLAQQSPIIILDEPTAFLDVTSRIETMQLLRQLAHSLNKTILLSTHDLDMAIELSDKIWLLNGDEPLISGTPAKLITSGEIGRFFNRGDIHFDIDKGRLRSKLTLG